MHATIENPIGAHPSLRIQSMHGILTRRLSLQLPPLRGEDWRGGTSHSDPVTTHPTGTAAQL